MRDCPPAPGHSAVLVPGQWELKEAEKRRTEVILIMIMKMLLIMKMMMTTIILILKRIDKNSFSHLDHSYFIIIRFIAMMHCHDVNAVMMIGVYLFPSACGTT